MPLRPPKDKAETETSTVKSQKTEAKPVPTSYMNVGTRHGCFPIAAPDGTRFPANQTVRYVNDRWAKAQVEAGILEEVPHEQEGKG